jgi:alpha,alpha-trehalose phosphorylase
VRDSSLSALTQAVLAAEVGQLQLAYDYLGETALIDLHDLEHNVRDGVHLAALAGTWTALVAGFGGLRCRQGALLFAPRLPAGIARLCFRVTFRGRSLAVDVTEREATYRLLSGDPFTVRHHREEIALAGNQPVTRHIPVVEVGPRPTQPPGRAPQAWRLRTPTFMERPISAGPSERFPSPAPRDAARAESAGSGDSV